MFLLPAERAHYVAMNGLRFICSIPFGSSIIKSLFAPKNAKSIKVFGLSFPHMVGLGAGFDKNAKYLRELQALGFGAVEIGTVTPLAQDGNPKPRLFRLPQDKGLINRMGFNNDGVEAIVNRLKKFKADANNTLIIGGNIGKNKITANDTAWKDYEISFRQLHPYVDYFVVNVSSPNTPGLRELQEKDALRKILENLQTINANQPQQKPILLKIAPDLTLSQVDDVLALAKEIKLDGLVISNTTIDRDNLSSKGKQQAEAIGAGGLSGAAIRAMNTDLVQYAANQLKGQIPIIASGGIMNKADAKEKLESGASLVQVWTGFVYMGPGIIREIVK